MIKKIIFSNKMLLIGGIEKTLIELLKEIKLSNTKIELVIDENYGENNLQDVPKHIETRFLNSKKISKLKLKYNNPVTSLELILNILTRIYFRFSNSYKKRRLLKKLELSDIFLDFDSGSFKYIKKIKCKKIAIQHSSPTKLIKKEMKIKKYGKYLNNYDLIVTVCDEMKKEIEEIYPYLKNKVKRIYNPLNFNKIKKMSLNKSELSIQEKELIKKKYFVSVSRLDLDSKDYLTLLKAFKLYKDKGSDKKLYIVGDGPDRIKIEKWIQDLNLIEEVVILGMKKNPYVWIKNSELLIHSSKYEGFGLVLVEAMILKIPVISSNCPVGPSEILEYGKSGLLYNVGDFLALSNQIEKITKNLNLKQTLIENATKRIEEFKVDKIIKEYEEILSGDMC